MAFQITGVSIVCSTVCSRRSKKTSQLHATGLCEGNPPMTSQRANNAENVSSWWRHHGSVPNLANKIPIWMFYVHRNGRFIRVTALVFIWDVDDKLPSLQFIPGYLPETHFSSILAKSRSPITAASIIQSFELLHRARQDHCRTLCKISKWFDNWGRSYKRTRFCEIWVKNEFRTHIL